MSCFRFLSCLVGVVFLQRKHECIYLFVLSFCVAGASFVPPYCIVPYNTIQYNISFRRCMQRTNEQSYRILPSLVSLEITPGIESGVYLTRTSTPSTSVPFRSRYLLFSSVLLSIQQNRTPIVSATTISFQCKNTLFGSTFYSLVPYFHHTFTIPCQTAYWNEMVCFAFASFY